MPNPDTITTPQRRKMVAVAASAMAKFKVELDLHLVYEPPMDDNDVGIIITRAFELPFAPLDGMRVYSREWEDCPEPQGMELKDVVWDADRQVFLATAYHISVDFPIAILPLEVRSWLDKGWEWGSYLDRYQREDTSKAPRRLQPGKLDGPAENLDSDLEERLHTLPPDQRPAWFNNLFRALIRHMVSTYSSLETAYAMDKLGRYLGPERRQACDAELREQWETAQLEYKRLSNDELWKWIRCVEKKYPKLASAVLGGTQQASP